MLTDQEVVIFALKDAGRVIAEHLDPGRTRDPEETLARLIRNTEQARDSARHWKARTGIARREMIQTAKNARRQWADEDDRQLREMAGAGKSITMMAVRLKRTVSAVRGRLSILKVHIRKTPSEHPAKKNPPA